MCAGQDLIIPRRFPDAKPNSVDHQIDNEALRLNLLTVFKLWDASKDGVRIVRRQHVRTHPHRPIPRCVTHSF